MENIIKEDDFFKYYELSLSNKISEKDCLELYEKDTYFLIYLAYSIKKYIWKKNNIEVIDLCSIINAKSGKCPENCIFCSQSIYNNTNIPVYGLLSKNKILSYAKSLDKYANRFSIVVSGKSLSDGEFEHIVDTVKLLKKETNLNICLSLGELSLDRLKILKELNVRIHHNLETSMDYFPNICTTHTYNDKLKTLLNCKKLKLDICSGGLFGLGESRKDRIKLFMDLKKIGVKGVPLNFIHPIEGTKIYKKIVRNEIDKLSTDEILKTIAIGKICLPYSEIRLCGGRHHNLGELQVLSLPMLDGLMIGNYLTTKGREVEKDIKILKKMNLLK